MKLISLQFFKSNSLILILIQFQNQQQMNLTIPSKKIQINQFEHELTKDFLSEAKQSLDKVTGITIQGNSYSVDFFDKFSENILAKADKIQNLDISDIFVARSKEEIPKSIQMIATSLVGKNIKRLDISHNAVNPFGAKALLKYLCQADSLQVFLISNCGLGPLGAAQIAKGLEGTPNLKTFSIGRNRMQSEGIKSISNSIKHIPKLQQLFIYQNTLRKQGLTPLFIQLRQYCKGLKSFDLCDNFVREQATEEMGKLIIESLELKDLNLSDCLNEDENDKIIEAFQETKNRNFERLGFNFVEMTEELAFRLLQIVKECPIKRLDITGNDFNKKTKKAYEKAFEGNNVLSKFDDDDEDDEEQVTRLFEEMKI